MQMRGKLRIAKFNARLCRWTKEEDDSLRTMQNQDFSLRFNRTVAEIQQRRYDLGIPQPKREYPWTELKDALLGKMSDPDFARQFGRPHASISPRRRQLGILAFHPRHKAWAKAEDELLGTMSDRKLAKRLGRTEVAMQVWRVKLRFPVANSTYRP